MDLQKRSIGAIILAAGKSMRMGEPKLLLPLNQKPVFLFACEVALRLSLSPILLICGTYYESMKKHVECFPEITVLNNPNNARGMSTSLKLGIETLKHKVDAALIFLADQPLIPAHVIYALINCYEANKKSGTLIVRPTYQGRVGHPVLISANIFHDFTDLRGDGGGKNIILKYKSNTELIDFNNVYWGKDIDTPEDYRKIKSYLSKINGLF